MSKLDMYLHNFGVANLPPKNKPTQGRLATPEEINKKKTKSKKQKRKEAKTRKLVRQYRDELEGKTDTVSIRKISEMKPIDITFDIDKYKI